MHRIALLIAVIAIFSDSAFAQGGCTRQLAYALSGYAGSEQEGPGGSSTWQSSLAQDQLTYRGAGPVCNYTDYGDHWYGECESYKWACTATPQPPPAAGSETTCNECTAGQPINLATGNTYILQSDLSIPGLGGGLRLDRIWNSKWPYLQTASAIGRFGSNWRSTYEERIFVDGGGVVKYSRADGSFWSFLLYGSPAAYQIMAPANEQVTLTQQNGVSWTVTFLNGEKRIFDFASGNLTSIQDRNGNTTTLTYDGTGRLTTVTDAAGRHLNFTYGTGATNFLVTQVTSDPAAGLTFTYAYDTTVTPARLTKVTKPDTTFVTFQYDTNGLISAVNDTDGKLLESHTYDAFQRGTSSSRANGVESLTITY